jgi:hypothetical protein
MNIIKTLIPPTFIIIGAQKSGTTALYSFLNRHPLICGSNPKETDFFYSDNFFEKGICLYNSFFRVNRLFTKKRITFEASPSYLNDDRGIVARRIHEYNPNIKLICILRDPVYRAYSAWNMYKKFTLEDRNFFLDWHKARNHVNLDSFLKKDNIHITSFYESIRLEIDAIANNKKVELPVVVNGLYYQKLKQFFGIFNPNQILILDNSELDEQPGRVLNSIMQFLGIDTYDWRDILKTEKYVLKGDYQEDIDIESSKLLKDFYRNENLKLFNLINKTFDWL